MTAAYFTRAGRRGNFGARPSFTRLSGRYTRGTASDAILWEEVQLHAPTIVVQGLPIPSLHLHGHPSVAKLQHNSLLTDKRSHGNLYDLLGPLDAREGVEEGTAATGARHLHDAGSRLLVLVGVRCRRRSHHGPSLSRRRRDPCTTTISESTPSGRRCCVIFGMNVAVLGPDDGNEGTGPSSCGGGLASSLGWVAVGEASILVAGAGFFGWR